MCNPGNINPWSVFCDQDGIEIFSSRHCVQTFDVIFTTPVLIYIINGRSLDYSLLAINSRGLRSAALRSTSWEIKLCAGRLLPPAAATASRPASPPLFHIWEHFLSADSPIFLDPIRSYTLAIIRQSKWISLYSIFLMFSCTNQMFRKCIIFAAYILSCFTK